MDLWQTSRWRPTTSEQLGDPLRVMRASRAFPGTSFAVPKTTPKLGHNQPILIQRVAELYPPIRTHTDTEIYSLKSPITKDVDNNGEGRLFTAAFNKSGFPILKNQVVKPP